MELIDRYIQEVKRHLSRRNRQDILAELRSALVDAVEDRAAGEPTEDQVAEVLKEFGPPREVAASYQPETQYLIGPALFPLFKMVALIALAAVVGAQLLAWVVAIFLAGESFAPWDALAGLLSSIPMTLGWVVVVFYLLQRAEVQPELKGEDWDPYELPEVQEGEEIKRGELITGIVFSVLLLVLFTLFPENVGFLTTEDWVFYSNPVILRHLGWITASLLAGIILNIYLLWQGRWTPLTRVLKIAVNIFNIAVLAVLYQGHVAWLAERNAVGFLSTVERIPEMVGGSWQELGMQAFRMGLGIGLLVAVIETVILVVRRVIFSLNNGEERGQLPTG
jgi:hypothetical protein